MSKEKEQIAIFIDHDIFVRHFLKPDSFDVILKKYKVTLVVPSKSNKRLKSDLSFLSNKLWPPLRTSCSNPCTSNFNKLIRLIFFEIFS